MIRTEVSHDTGVPGPLCHLLRMAKAENTIMAGLLMQELIACAGRSLIRSPDQSATRVQSARRLSE